MNVLSLGAGAIGGVIAARLTGHGLAPLVVDADPDLVGVVATSGLVVEGLGEGAKTVLDAVPAGWLSEAQVRAADLVLLAVRSGSTEAAIAQIEPALREDANVVSLQNGLNEDTIARVVGAKRTIGCVVGIGVTWIEPGRVSLDATGELTLGRMDGGRDEALDRARELLDHAFPTQITSNIRGALWAKMLVNSMTVLGALGGMLTGELLATHDRRLFVAGVVAEGVRVAIADGVVLPKVFGAVDADLVCEPARFEQALDDALIGVSERFGPIKSVTWRDFELGRATEIDAVTGEIVRRGGGLGVPTPLSSAVYSMLREIESGSRKPSADNLTAPTVTAPR